MTAKNAIFLWVIFLFSGLFFLKWPTDDKLQLIACNIGQGDAILIQKGRVQVLVDEGPDDSVLNCLEENMPPLDRTLEVVVMTHQDKDHIGGLESVINKYKIDQIVSNGREVTTKTFMQTIEAIHQAHIPLRTLKMSEVFQEGDMHFRVLWPPGEFEENSDKSEKNADKSQSFGSSTNAYSIVLRLEMGDFSALLTGDLETPQEKLLITSGETLHSRVLKVGHHGSKGATSSEFLEAVHPDVALISVGKGNRYGHPTARVLDLLEEKGVLTYRTDRDGTVILETDGKAVWRK